jgi:hypothetical protein
MTLRMLLWLMAVFFIAWTAVHLYRSTGGKPRAR